MIKKPLIMSWIRPDTNIKMCTGKNTIRKASQKYYKLSPGDKVKMVHETENGYKFALEDLTVNSILIGRFDKVLMAAWMNNIEQCSHDDLKIAIEQCYGGIKAEDDVFCITFN